MQEESRLDSLGSFLVHVCVYMSENLMLVDQFREKWGKGMVRISSRQDTYVGKGMERPIEWEFFNFLPKYKEKTF